MSNAILLDGDFVLWHISSALEVPTDWGNGIWTLHGDLDEAIHQTDIWIAELKDRLEARRCRIAFTDYQETNWRKAVLPTYKSNRKGGRKPVVYMPLREYLIGVYEC